MPKLSWDFGDGTQADGAVAKHVFTKPGIYNITLIIPGEIRPLKYVYIVSVTEPQGIQFSQALQTELPGRILVMGDFNGDGFLDLITYRPHDFYDSMAQKREEVEQFALYAQLGRGDGTFSEIIWSEALPVLTKKSLVSFSAQSGDFNGDKKLDWVLVYTRDDYFLKHQYYVHFFFGDGQRSFRVTKTPMVKEQAQSLEVADFDNDGKADLAWVTRVTGQNFFDTAQTSLLIWFGKPDETFDEQKIFDWPSHEFVARRALAADLNGDGFVDLVLEGKCGLSGVSVAARDGEEEKEKKHLSEVKIIFNQGSRIFKSGQELFLPSEIQKDTCISPYFITDIDGDKKVDIGIQTFGELPDSSEKKRKYAHKLWDFSGLGDGAFRALAQKETENASMLKAIADFNRDGKPDLIFNDAYSEESLRSEFPTFFGVGELISDLEAPFFVAKPVHLSLGKAEGGYDVLAFSPFQENAQVKKDGSFLSAWSVRARDWNNDQIPDITIEEKRTCFSRSIFSGFSSGFKSSYYLFVLLNKTQKKE
jgi:hypothetical protein